MASFLEKVLDYYTAVSGKARSEMEDLQSLGDGGDVDGAAAGVDVKANIPTMKNDFTVN
jgi:hypothetical protein